MQPRHTFTSDLHRPVYHFMPPTNWMNDPNGVIQWKGQYHLFYQYNPNGAYWGNMHWAHAVSDDLIHWRDLPIALAPTPGSADESGCFSGCTVDNNGVPTILYTAAAGVRCEIQTQSIATGDDELVSWTKYEGNPVLKDVPHIAGQTDDFRDPFVWRESTPQGDVWYMVLSSRIVDVGGAVFLYRSRDLVTWEFMHPLLIGDKTRNGTTWECANFFPLGEGDRHWVLIISSYGDGRSSVIYFVGEYADHRFTVLNEGVLEYGHLYAPLTMLDDRNRRIMFGWVREHRSEDEQRRAGWSGAQSIPRVLTLDEQRRVIMTPVEEFAHIRGTHHRAEALDVAGITPLNIAGLALELSAEFEVAPDGECGIGLNYAADSQERTEIVYRAADQRLIVRKLSAEDGSVAHLYEAAHPLDRGESLRLHILFDHSVVEVIANGRTSIVSRTYPVELHNGVCVLGEKARLVSLDAWEMPRVVD